MTWEIHGITEACETLLEELCQQLSQRQSSNTISNPYQHPDCLQNLRQYLVALQQHHACVLCVGEAPGYQGCRLTGIPFTSERILREHPHAFLDMLRPKLMISGNTAEPTATVMWNTLQDCVSVPILWNTFPFHPHRPDRPLSNRAPTSTEVLEGRVYLDLMIKMFAPTHLAGIGRQGQRTLQQLDLGMAVQYIRHPSRGGKRQFQAGIQQLFQRIPDNSS